MVWMDSIYAISESSPINKKEKRKIIKFTTISTVNFH